MVKVLRSFAIVSVMTACCLLYTAFQIELYRVSYSIQAKRQTLVRIQDVVEKVRIRVSKLKALEALEEKVQENNIPLIIPEEIKAFVSPQIEDPIERIQIPAKDSFFSLFEFVRNAHAKTILPKGE
ncbi:MAG TPA: hypothetical protein PKL97_04300 [Candidatus Omnitrophota bacterium]|nr:hypothetical protein [Candidatus Omnitrophota bacterium]